MAPLQNYAVTRHRKLLASVAPPIRVHVEGLAVSRNLEGVSDGQIVGLS
jgi:hypothetical protein